MVLDRLENNGTFAFAVIPGRVLMDVLAFWPLEVQPAQERRSACFGRQY